MVSTEDTWSYSKNTIIGKVALAVNLFLTRESHGQIPESQEMKRAVTVNEGPKVHIRP